jgi:hypothetical protein
MKWFASAVLSLALMSSAAMAEERRADAALGAVGDVLGSIGAAAAAVNGYVAGPSISHSNHSSAPRRARSIASSRDAGVGTGQPAPTPSVPRDQAAPQAAAAAQPSASSTASIAPPVQPLE